MKRIAVIGLAVILILIPVMAVNCDSNGDNGNSGDSGAIKNVIRDMWNAFNEGNYEQCLTYCTNYGDADEEIAEMTAMKAFTGNVTVESIEIINIGGSTAVAYVTLQIADQTDTDVVKLDKIDGSWKYDVEYDGSESGYASKDERKTEKQKVQKAVEELMEDNGLSVIPNPVSSATATNNMGAFPDTTSDDDTNGDKMTDPMGNAYTIATGNDLPGYVLCGHDNYGDNSTLQGYNYLSENMRYTTYYYTIDSDGTVHQFIDAAKTSGELN